MKKVRPKRHCPEGVIPLIDVEGTPYDAGVLLGYAWQEALKLTAQKRSSESVPWWADRRFRKLIDRLAPHLPDLYRGMSKGAGVPEEQVTTPMTRSPLCTSFAVKPSVTLDGIPISGQTKDTPLSQAFRYQVLRLKLKGAPSALTLTYPGWLFGHGFVQGGCSIFRNSLYAGPGKGLLPYDIWGLLALHCPTVDEVAEFTREHGVLSPAHCTIADEHGGVIGIEMGKGGIAILKPKRGIYTHANAVVSGNRLRKHEATDEHFAADSLHREGRLRANLEADAGRLTAQLAYMALCDHVGFPRSVCRHESDSRLTSSAVVAEPTRGLLHVSRGTPCQNWPKTYTL